MLPLRDYQEQAVTETLTALRQHKSTLFVCPTGGGKTFVFAELAARYRPHGRILVLADRESLVQQAAETIKARTSLTVGIEQGAARIKDELPDVVCATIQSMRLRNRLAKFPASTFGLIVIDEADLSIAPSYARVLDCYPGAKIFGCTATPDRADGKSLSVVFDSAITPLHLGELMRRRFLSPMRRTLIQIKSVTLTDVSLTTADYSASDLERLLIHERALHEVVRPSIDLSGTRPTIVFGATVKHAEALAEIYNRYRPGSAAVIHGGMSSVDRKAIIDAYKTGTTQFLCSCALLLRGVDLPLTSCIVMARPTHSRALYCQAIGRGTRLADGKKELVVLDFTDNSRTHDLVSPIDILGPIAPEVREHAKQIADNEAECDPLEVIQRAEAELQADPRLRAALLARVEYSVTRADIDWDNVPLGKVSDQQLARQLSVTASGVGYQRRARNIAAFKTPTQKHPINWNAVPWDLMTTTDITKAFGIDNLRVHKGRKIAGRLLESSQCADVLRHNLEINADNPYLGKMDDHLLAFCMRVRVQDIVAERERRGIPAYIVDFEALPLGQAPDGVIALNYRLHRDTVRDARRERGIDPYHAASAEMPSVSQQRVQRERSRRGIAPCQPKRRQDMSGVVPLLGTMSDRALAQQTGTLVSTINRLRRKHQVPKFVQWQGRGLEELGTKPDAEIAASQGVAPHKIRYQRHKHGIKSPAQRTAKKRRIAEWAAEQAESRCSPPQSSSNP